MGGFYRATIARGVFFPQVAALDWGAPAAPIDL